MQINNLISFQQTLLVDPEALTLVVVVADVVKPQNQFVVGIATYQKDLAEIVVHSASHYTLETAVFAEEEISASHLFEVAAVEPVVASNVVVVDDIIVVFVVVVAVVEESLVSVVEFLVFVVVELTFSVVVVVAVAVVVGTIAAVAVVAFVGVTKETKNLINKKY